MVGRNKTGLARGWAIVLTIAIILTPQPGTAQEPLEFQVKAAFLYNFAKFVEWPDQAFANRDSAFTICLAGDPFQGALEKTVQGEAWNGRPLSVRRIDSGAEVRSCQVVYVSGSSSQKSMEILMAAANAPVLTVGETDDFISAGGIIRFTESGRRVRFEINPEAAQRAALRVSSRLLRLADIVRPRQRAGN
jgi:hypothetical protein